MQTVLVVDDNTDGRALAATALRQAGLRVLEAVSGDEALRVARQHPDLIVLDLHLPGVDGFEVCRQIKADPATADIPVVAATAVYFGAEERHAALAAGADAFFTRPVDWDGLVRVVTQLIAKRRAS